MSSSTQPSLWRRVRNSWRARGKKPGAVDPTPEGFVFTQKRRATPVRWDEVVRIDAGTRDYISIDLFFVVFHTSEARVTIDEFDDGFRFVEGSAFARWPDLRERWVALQCGPLHQPQYETLWRRVSTVST